MNFRQPDPLMFYFSLSDEAKAPFRATARSAGWDLYAQESRVMPPGSRYAFSTGLRVALPVGHVGRIVARSGLALSAGITALCGSCDEDYDQEIKVSFPLSSYQSDKSHQSLKVVLYNSSDKHVEIGKGMFHKLFMTI